MLFKNFLEFSLTLLVQLKTTNSNCQTSSSVVMSEAIRLWQANLQRSSPSWNARCVSKFLEIFRFKAARPGTSSAVLAKKE